MSEIEVRKQMNPCDTCERKNWASGCDSCILDIHSTGECHNDKCFLNYECGCTLGLDDYCKASDAYRDDFDNHDCNECENLRTGADGMLYCELTGDEVGRWDDACEDFKEKEGEE